VLASSQNLVVIGRDGQVKQQSTTPRRSCPDCCARSIASTCARRLYGAAASAYGDAFAQMSRQCDGHHRQASDADSSPPRILQGGTQLTVTPPAAAMASKRFKASLATPTRCSC